MEIGQPDEVGALGEKAAGPLSLARPEAKPLGCGSYSLAMLGAGIFGVVTGLIQREWSGALMRLTDWSKDGADDTIKILMGLASWGLWIAATALLRWKRLNDGCSPPRRLVLERRMPKQRPRQTLDAATDAAGERNPVRLEYSYQVWRANTFLRRGLSPVIFCSAGAALGFGAAHSFRVWDGIAMAVLSLLCWLSGLPDLTSLYRPLLWLDERGVGTGSRFVPWERVQKVKVEHLLDFQGVYYSTSWLITGDSGRRARISIPKNRCSQSGEEELLAFVAQKLGSRIGSVASPVLDSL